MKPRPDFINIRLTAAGQAFSGGAVRVVTERMNYAFQGDQPVEVLRFAEWPSLQRDFDDKGNPLFEEAPADGTATIPQQAPEEGKER